MTIFYIFFAINLPYFLLKRLTKKSPFKGKDVKEILTKNKQNVIIYKKVDWKNISDSLRRLVFDLTMKEPDERLSLNQLMKHKWLKPQFKEGCDEIKKEKKNKKSNFEEFHSKIQKYESEGDFPRNSSSNRNLRVISPGNSQNFVNFALNSVNSLFIQTGATSENNSYYKISPGKSFNSDSPSIR